MIEIMIHIRVWSMCAVYNQHQCLTLSIFCSLNYTLNSNWKKRKWHWTLFSRAPYNPIVQCHFLSFSLSSVHLQYSTYIYSTVLYRGSRCLSFHLLSVHIRYGYTELRLCTVPVSSTQQSSINCRSSIWEISSQAQIGQCHLPTCKTTIDIFVPLHALTDFIA